MEQLTTSLPYRQPKYPFELWVFGSNNQCYPHFPSSSTSQLESIPETLSDKITSALCKYVIGPQDHILIQFWAPIALIGGRCVLTTLDQPYGLSTLHSGLCSYREHSLAHVYEVHEEDDDRVLGLPGRVFRRKVLESTPDVRHYSANEYPQRDFAVGCGIRGSLAFPVFDPSGQSCVGVLEIVGTEDDLQLEYFKVRYVITEIAHLQPPFKHNLFENNILNDIRPAVNEIHEVLVMVCKTHQLPLAQSWVRSNTIVAAYDMSDKISSKDTTLVAISAASDRLTPEWLDYKWACAEYSMTERQWLVGNSFQSQNPCFCMDITQFSITEYPFSHYAQNCGSTGCFTICLHSSLTGNKLYVLEFFLPSSKLDIEDPTILLGSLLATMKQHFRSFKVASVGEEGDELFVQVIKVSMGEKPDTLKICQNTGSPPRVAALEDDGKEVPMDSSHEHVIGNSSSSLENTFVLERSDKRISYTDLELHFGVRTLIETAEILEVSRSTLKRVCRTYGILRWPSCRRNKQNGLPPRSNVRRGVEFSRFVEEPECSRDQHLSSDKPPSQASTSVAHTISDTAMQDVNDSNAVTVKAKYGSLVIKFQLSTCGGMAELKEKVSQRLKLKEGSFVVQYQDEEEEWILIACDEDLQECMNSSRLLRKPTIRMLIDHS